MDDFSQYPESLGERRSAEESNGALWTPRDALIAMLRDIDSGRISPDALIVCYREAIGTGDVRSSYFNASADIHQALGLLAATSIKLMK